MNPEQYGQLAVWIARGTAEVKVTNGWSRVWCLPDWPTCEREAFDGYRERPTQPPLPDEVWIAEYQGFQFNSVLGAHKTREHCASGNDGATPIRYIRADGLIDCSRLQFRFKWQADDWYNPSNCEYRFKP